MSEIWCFIDVKNARNVWLNVPWLRRFCSAQMAFILWCIKAGEKATLWLNNTIVSIIPFSTDRLKSGAYLELPSWELCRDKRAHTTLKKESRSAAGREAEGGREGDLRGDPAPCGRGLTREASPHMDPPLSAPKWFYLTHLPALSGALFPSLP